MKSFIIVLVFLLAGCCTPEIIEKPQIVEVPVMVKCKPTVTITPITHPFDKAKKDMSLYDKLKLALAELSLVKGQNKELTAALTECTK